MPAVILFVGFVSYFSLTIGLTQWRKRVRMDMNRKVRWVGEGAGRVLLPPVLEKGPRFFVQLPVSPG
jgi:hypothetical protein